MKLKYICNPNVTYQILENNVVFYNHYYDDRLATDNESLGVFEFFRTPQFLDDLQLNDEKRNFLNVLCKRFYILNCDEVSFLSTGLLSKNENLLGDFLNIGDFSSINFDNTQAIYAVVGIPFDLGSMRGGARLGVNVIRESFQKYRAHIQQAVTSSKKTIYDFDLRRKYKLDNWALYDMGDVRFDFNEGIENLILRTRKVIRILLENGIKPVILGGDHTITYFVLQGINDHYKDFGLMQLDAHHDIYLNTFHQRNSLTHGNFIFHALKILGLKHVHNIGLRTFEYLSDFSEKNRDKRITYVSSREIKTNGIKEIHKSIDPNLAYHLSVDLDILNPASRLEVGAPVIGGLEYYDLLEIFQEVLSKVPLISLDFVETFPSSQMGNYAAEVVSRLLTIFFLHKQPFDIID